MSTIYPHTLSISGLSRGYTARGTWPVAGVLRLPTDPIGIMYVTFNGVHADSEIRIFNGTTELAGVESCDVNHELSWNVYAEGSPNNNITIKIVNVIYKTIVVDYISYLGTIIFPVQQVIDPWYKNPL